VSGRKDHGGHQHGNARDARRRQRHEVVRVDLAAMTDTIRGCKRLRRMGESARALSADPARLLRLDPTACYGSITYRSGRAL